MAAVQPAALGHQLQGDFETHLFYDHMRMPSENRLKFSRLWRPLEGCGSLYMHLQPTYDLDF